MDNTRYGRFVRVAGLAGLLSAAILLVNAAKRGMLIPNSSVAQLLAPVAEVAAIIFVLGLLVWSGLRTRLATIATLVNVVALALLVGVEFVINLVLPQLTPDVRDDVLSGPLAVALVISSMTFLVATLLLVAAFWRRAAHWALVAYGVGATVVALRSFVPELALDLALATMALGIVGLSVRLLFAHVHAASLTQPAR